MNKNLIIILLIFLVPLGVYFGLSRGKSAALPFTAAEGAEIIKFSSPMCYECLELEKVFEEVFPQYRKEITLNKVDVTQNDNSTKALVKQYDVRLVPTTVFKNADGNITRRIEGAIQPKILENYLKELVNG